MIDVSAMLVARMTLRVLIGTCRNMRAHIRCLQAEEKRVRINKGVT